MATSVIGYFQVQGATVDGDYAEMDDLRFYRQSIVTQSDNLITLSPPTPLTQAGAAGLRPTYLPLAAAVAQGLTCPCWKLDGAAQFWSDTAMAAAVTGNDPSWTWTAWLRPSALAATVTLAAGTSSISDTIYRAIQMKATGTLTVNFRNGVTTKNMDSAAGLFALNTWAHVAVVSTVGSIVGYVNGAVAIPAFDATVGNIALDRGSLGALVRSTTDGWFPGHIANAGLAAAVPWSQAQVQAHMAITRPQGV